ncbi:COP9 signalosome complex subunit 3 [Echria macrotheca]|uniref:COP9 signalosome complex subunit 3 n=1 Tax=Echria macrotheca TaxID=438768 RepID=A0AAJ0BBK5_9PEZI|nr:COP9 signalosome complex subunit 3 [Echria macrotheca]
MERFLPVLLDFPESPEPADNQSYDKAIRRHLQRLEQLIKDDSSSFTSHARELLKHVDPTINSISYLALLQAVLSGEKTPQADSSLLSCITKFLLTFDGRQMRYVASALSRLLSLVEEGVIFPASIAVELLATALLRFDPTGTMLTCHHLALVKMAYTTDNIDLVLPVIEQTVVFYPGMKGTTADGQYLCDMQLYPSTFIFDDGFTTKLSSTMVLRYEYECALCFISKRSWQRAFDALQRIITFPSKDTTCSKIMAEGYKKWLLVGLLLTGKTPSLPALTYGGPQKAYGVLGKPYAAIAKAFEGDSADVLKAEFESLGPQFWAEEGNLGLMNEVLSHYQRWKIVDLSAIYTKISLEEIRQLTQSAETGGPLETVEEIFQLLVDMVKGGMLKGVPTLPANGQPGYLEFFTEAEDLSERDFADQIARIATRVAQLQPLMKATNDRLTTSREYLRYLSKEQKNKDKDGRDPVANFETQIEDEDLMTGVMIGP